jgi:hypothetical protein
VPGGSRLLLTIDSPRRNLISNGGSKRVLAGVLFGVGMAIAAVNFLAWLFPG